ncbi:MAG: hypothetical protein IAE79_05745 [Anaerolinea sp.]|nr:hypothetical protein [Anaerolinea sp.]
MKQADKQKLKKAMRRVKTTRLMRQMAIIMYRAKGLEAAIRFLQRNGNKR